MSNINISILMIITVCIIGTFDTALASEKRLGSLTNENLYLIASHGNERFRSLALAELVKRVEEKQPESGAALSFVLLRVNDRSWTIRSWLTHRLGGIEGDDVCEALLKLTRDSVHEVRISSVQSLGLRREEGATPALVYLLRDSDREMRFAAIQALRNKRLTDYVGDISDCLKDDFPDIRKEAIECLLQINSPASNAKLCSHVLREVDEKNLSVLVKNFKTYGSGVLLGKVQLLRQSELEQSRLVAVFLSRALGMKLEVDKQIQSSLKSPRARMRTLALAVVAP